MYIGLHVQYSLFLWDFNDIWNFSIDVRKILKYHISGKFVQWEPSCSMRTDGRTDRQIDMIKLTVAFRNFANAPKNRPHFYVMLTNKMHFFKINVLIQLFWSSACFEHLCLSLGWPHCTCSFIWYVFHAFMQAVFLMMNIRCSKHVEDKKNWIKTLI